MQRKKLELQNEILVVAKNEFLKTGYKKTSLRKIGSVLNMSHGNIMTYFTNKEHLFEKVIEPAVDFLENTLIKPCDYSDEWLRGYADFDLFHTRNIKLYKEIHALKDEFYILFFKSAYSDYKDFRKKTREKICITIDCYIKELVKREMIPEIEISETFKKTIASLIVDSIENIIVYDLSDKEILKYATEMTMIINQGVNIILGINKNLEWKL